MSPTALCPPGESGEVTARGLAPPSPATAVYAVPFGPPIDCEVYHRALIAGITTAAVLGDGGWIDAAIPHWFGGRRRTAARIASAMADAPSSFGCSPSPENFAVSLFRAESMSMTWTMPSNSAISAGSSPLKVFTSASPMPAVYAAYPAVSSRAVLHTSTGSGVFASSQNPSNRTTPRPASSDATVMIILCDAFALATVLIRSTPGLLAPAVAAIMFNATIEPAP